MTDKARELLERCAFQLGNENMTYWNAGLVEEIRTYLAEPEVKPQPFNQAEFDEMVRKGTDAWKDYKPEQDEEPVAPRLADELHYAQEIIFEGCGYKLISPEDADEIVAELRRLYPAPRPEFVRLSEEEVNEILSSAHTPYEAICAAENRLVEKNK